MRKNRTAEVIESFAKKRDLAQRESENRTFEIHSAIPEVFEIDKELFSTSVNVMTIAMSGEDIEKKMNALQKRNEELQKKRGEILVANGYPADYTDVKFECSKCSDTGFVGIHTCECLKKAVALAAFEDSGIGHLVKKQSFESFSLEYYAGDDKNIVNKNLDTLKVFANDFSKEKGNNYILMGDTGLGKTHLSTSVAKVVIEKGFKVVYITIHDIMSDFEAQRFHGTLTDEDLSIYFDCDLLIVDDFGSEVANQFTISCIYNLINSRINNRKSTVISTNLTMADMREKYSDRITSRIFGEYRPLIFAGKDIRKQKLNNK